MAAAIGATAPNTRGDTFFDVYEWGGRPGDKTGSVDRALEAIRNYIINVRDAGAKDTKNSPAIIYFRDSTKHWFLQRPFFLELDGWEIRGAGREQSTVEMIRPSRAPCFILGMPRAPRFSSFQNYDGRTPLVLDASHWVDCYGVLDSTAAAAPGVRWGLRLKNDSNISCPLTPLSHGVSDGWTSTRQMTVDFCINPGDGLKLTNSDLFGMGDSGAVVNGPKPWQFQVIGTNLIRFLFATTGTNQPSNQSVQFSLGDCTGLMRVSFQIDLVNAKAQAYVSCPASATYNTPQQIPVTINNPSAFQAGNNMSFARNPYFPFNIGKRGAMVVSQSQANTVDHTYFGLQVCNTLLYVDASAADPIGYVGKPQVRVDGRPITDKNRYFDYDYSVACLQLTDPPPGNPLCFNDGRVITIRAGGYIHGDNVTAAGYFLSTNIWGTPVYGMYNRIQDITVYSGGPTLSGFNGTAPGGWFTAFGQAIAIGGAWEVYIQNVTAMAFGQGIGSLNAGAAYTIHVDDCNLGGGDAGYYGFWQGVNMNRVTVLTQGRTGLRFASCGAVINDLFEGDASVGTDAGIMIHYGQYGGQFTITNFIYDNELNYGPSMAAIVCEGSDIAPPYFRIENLAIGVLPDNAVGIWLKDATGGINNYLSPAWNAPPRDLIVDGYSVYGSNHTAQIRTDGTLWHGTVDNFQLAYGGFTTLESVPMFDHTGPGGVGRIVHRSREYSMPPRSGKWDTGGHILEMQLPQPGQYATLRCVRTGTMNTATPPLWNGAEPIGSEFDSLGGYLVDHSYWAPVALS